MQQVAEDDAASTITLQFRKTWSQNRFDIYCCEDYAVNALQAPESKPKAPSARPSNNKLSSNRSGSRFLRNPNFRNPNPQGNFRPRFPAPPQKKPMTPEMKKFMSCVTTVARRDTITRSALQRRSNNQRDPSRFKK